MDGIKCIICKETVEERDKKSYSVVTGKGVYSIVSASKERDDVLEIAVGVVHVSCCARYTNKRSIEQDKKTSSSDPTHITKKAGLRFSDAFDYISQCLYCTNTVTQRERRDKKAYQVMSKNQEFDKTILQTCEKRNDLWALTVKGRIAYANDLHTAGAVYHTLCDSAFRNGKSFPKKYKNESSSVEPPAKCSKPVNVDRATAFNHVVEYLQENDEEQLTINDLVMDEQLKNNPHEAFSSKWMKDRLMEQLRNDIVISEINGISDSHFEEESITHTRRCHIYSRWRCITF